MKFSMKFKNALNTGLCVLGLAVMTPEKAQAYPIDCAILLCLAGGWPASAECSAARAEFIRRITPWPVEPPLQIWRCPMGASFNAPAQQSFRSRLYNAAMRNTPKISITPAIVKTPEEIASQIILTNQADIDISGREFDFVRSIRVWNIMSYSYQERGRDGDCEEQYSIQLGTYGRQGDYSWARSAPAAVPGWVGMSRTCHPPSHFRGVGVEWRDHEGNHGFEVVRY